MKKLLALIALCGLSVGVLASRESRLPDPHTWQRLTLAGVDDPPPQPIDCPFCGGNPELHVKRVFWIENTMFTAAANALKF